MTGTLLNLSDRQPQNVQRRAIAAVSRQREQSGRRVMLADILDARASGVSAYPSLDAWYRAQPVPKGCIRPALRLTRDERPLYGLPVSARLVGLVGMATGESAIAFMLTTGGYVVGLVDADGTGVGVLWKMRRKANDYALRLAIEHGAPIREHDA